MLTASDLPPKDCDLVWSEIQEIGKLWRRSKSLLKGREETGFQDGGMKAHET